MAEIGAQNFSGHSGRSEIAMRWMDQWLRAPLLFHVFVIERNGRVVGYIDWLLHGGFGRQHAVAELDQIGLCKDEEKGRGVGEQLIRESLDAMRRWVQEHIPAATLLRTVVWFYANNTAAHGAYAKFFPEVLGFRTQFSEGEIMRRGTCAILDRDSPI